MLPYRHVALASNNVAVLNIIVTAANECQNAPLCSAIHCRYCGLFFAHEMTIMPVNHSQGMSAKILFIPWHDGVDAFNRAP